MFLSPLWLWALPLAALPVLAHLAFRSRRRRVVVPSLMFLHAAAPRLEARRRLRELLVLALRCAALAALALALAHPRWAGAGGGGSGAVVVLIDNSGSMSAGDAPGGGEPRLRLACAGAAALVAALGASDQAAVVTAVEDPAVPAADGLTGDRKRLRAVLDRVAETQAAAAPGAALRRAGALLAASSAGRRELHIFSDCQEREWGAAGEADALPPGTEVTVHRLPSAAVDPDAALAGIALPPRALLPGRPVPLRVTVENPGRQAVQAVLRAEDDAGRTVSAPVAVAPGARTEVPLALPAPEAGEHWARLRLEGDRFAADDEGFVAFVVGARREVRLLGKRAWYGALPLALDPGGGGALSGLSLAEVGQGRWDQALEGAPALVVATWDQLPADGAEAKRLQAWLRGGGRLLAVPRGGGGDPGALPAWLGVAVEGRLDEKAGAPLIAADPGHPAWRDLVGPDGQVALDARAARGARLRGGRALMATAAGAAVLVAAEAGDGAAWVLGLAPERAASTLPLSPAFVVLVQGLAAPAAGLTAAARRAGEALPAPAGAVHLRPVAGAAADWRGDAAALPPLPRAGVALVESAAGRAVVAVSADPGEGAPARHGGTRLPALGAQPHRVADWRGADAMVADWQARRSGLDLMPLMLALAVALFAAETWLANRPLLPGRPARTAAEPRRGAA